MYEKVSEEDVLFVATMHDPIAVKECIYPENIKAPHTWLDDNCKLYRVRNYQFSWQNYAHLLCHDSKLTKEDNFKKRKLAGDCYNIGARNTGKSFDFIQADAPINIINGAGQESCLGSATDGFLNKVITPIFNLFRNHPIFDMYKQSGKSEGIRGKPNYEIQSRPGHTLYGRNEKVDSPEPGTAFHGLHYEVLMYEESHYMSSKGEEKRIDAGSSLGVINRFSGIPDIRPGSPLGDILSKEQNKNFICRYPQFVRDDWNDGMRKERIDQYNGESSLAYKLNVIGEEIKGAEGFWDIERIKKQCLNKKRRIKHFDIDKKKFKEFEKHIVITRLPAQQVYVCADIGAGARPTEIIIVFYNNKKYRVEYNISLNKLSAKEQAKIFAWIYQQLGGAFIGLDATTDYGIKTYLVDGMDINGVKVKLPSNHVLSVDLRKNIPVGFQKEVDPNGKEKISKDSKGRDIVTEKRAIDWAMERLSDFMYEGKFDLPLDNKFFKEFAGYKIIQSGTRRSYDSSTTDDYHQAYQIFAVTQWDKEFESMRNQNNKSTPNCLGHF